MARVLGRALVALVSTLALAGAATPVLDGCASPLEVAAEPPSCCAKPTGDRVEEPARDCCRTAQLGEFEPTSATGTGPDVPPAAAVTLPGTLVATLAVGSWATEAFRPTVDRPPDRSPPTDTTVLLL